MKPRFISSRITAVAALLFALFFAQPLHAQEDSPTIYLEITKLKKMNDDLMDMEKELIMPFTQERIKQGNLLMHAMYRVNYPYSSDALYDYVVIEAYSDFSHLNLGGKKMREIVYATFPNADLPAMIERFEAAAKNIGSDVFAIRDEAFPGPEHGNDEPAKYLVINHMNVPIKHQDDYVAMESEVFKPLHQAAAKKGDMLDWLLAERVLPYGSDWDDNFLTFDLFSEWADIAGGDMGSLFKEVHPNKDMGAAWEKMVDLRDLRRSEVLERVSMVESPTPEVNYKMVKVGTGASPKKGQEVSYKGVLRDMEGNTLFSTGDLGFDFISIIGNNPYDRFFDKGLMKMKEGGVMEMTLLENAQGKSTKNISGGKDVVLEIELVSVGDPMASGSEWLEEIINKEGLETAKKKYAEKPEGYVFREGPMNSLGYKLMNNGDINAALYIFKLNQTNFPKSWNACDSLADGYVAAGDKSKAREHYKNALKLKPDFKTAKDKLDNL